MIRTNPGNTELMLCKDWTPGTLTEHEVAETFKVMTVERLIHTPQPNKDLVLQIRF